MSIRVLCVGRLYCDLIFTGTPRLPTFGTEIFADGLSLHAGGGAFITAATLAKLGVETAQVSTLPAAPFDTIVIADMAAHHVNADLCQPADPGQDPQITTAIATGGDRAFLTRASGAAIPEVGVEILNDFNHIHIGELRTLQEHPHLIEFARAAGATISLDCSWQDEFHSSVKGLIEKVDVFMPSENEEAALAAIGVSTSCAALTVVKCGEKGARACTRGSSDWVIGATEAVSVIDATGAGDAFNGGFLSKWLTAAPIEDCLATANACGAAAIQGAGGACWQADL